MNLKLTKIGNAHGLVLDAEMMELFQLKSGDEVSVEMDGNGNISLHPVRHHASREIFFDPTLMELADLQFGDQMDVDVYEGGMLMLTPIRNHTPTPGEVSNVIRATMKDYVQTMKLLA